MFFEPTGLPLVFVSFIAPSGICVSGLFVSNIVPLRDVALALPSEDNELPLLLLWDTDLPLCTHVATLIGGGGHD